MDTPELFQGAAAYHHSQFTGETRLSDAKNSDHFIDDLLDYPNDDGKAADGGFETTGFGGTSADSTVFDNSCNSSDSTRLYRFDGDAGCRNFTDGPFSCELFVPNDDLAELEWVSHFAEESFSNEDLYNMNLISGMEARNNNNGLQPEPNRATVTKMLRPEMAVPAKARSKRSRAPPCNWTSRLLAVSPSPPSAATTPPMTSSLVSSSESIASSSDKKITKNIIKNKEIIHNGTNIVNSEGRKCLHCATDQTPQWRTGPQGPKTLCNACGVRYKSGRLVPEYRPAASPTFVLTKHSNSHRKVMELRRQKELINSQQHHQQQFIHPNMMFDPSNVEDFLIHQQIGPSFRHLM